MISLEATEQRLRTALETEPAPDALRWLDGRVEQLLARHGETAKHAPPWRWLLRPLPLVVAFILLAGGVTAALTLIERVATQSGPGWAAAWELAEVIGQSQSDQGYTVTLERAYADINQVVTFVSVSADDPGLPDPGDGGSIWFDGGMHDASGRALEAAASTMLVENDLSATIGMWVDPTPQAGTYVLEVSSIQVLPGEEFNEETLPSATNGTWRFEFDLPEPTGVVVEPAAEASHEGLTIELTELRLAPTMIAGRMYLTIDGEPAPVWAATIAEVVQDGETVSKDNNADFMAIPLREQDATGVEFRTAFGTELTSGTWEFRISQIAFPEDFDPLAGADDDEWAPRSGDWVLTVEVP